MERKNYRIIALDMDGTLLTSDKTLVPDTVRDIRAASERGLHVVYCTGRAVPELRWRRLQNGITRCRISSRTTRPLLPQTM